MIKVNMKGDPPQSPYAALLIVSAFLSCLFLTSCTFHQKYPAEWAALISIEDNKCPDISGRYEIAGETIDKTRSYESGKAMWSAMPAEKTDARIRPLYLSEVFHTKYRDDITHATYAQISQPDADTLEISFMSDQGLIDKKAYSMAKKEYACSANGITFSFGRAHYSPGQAGAGHWGKYYLAKSIDGCLAVKEEGTASLIFTIFPVLRSYEVWHRFKQKSLP